jgi:hypothetical protein
VVAWNGRCAPPRECGNRSQRHVRLWPIATAKVTYGDGDTENLPSAEAFQLLEAGWIERERGHLTRVVDIIVLDDEAYEANLEKLRGSRVVLGRGLGRRRP